MTTQQPPLVNTLKVPEPQPLAPPTEAPPVMREGAFTWFVRKYWWVSLPIVYALGQRAYTRFKAGNLSAYHMLEDTAKIAAPGVAVLGVIALINQEYRDVKELKEEQQAYNRKAARSTQ